MAPDRKVSGYLVGRGGIGAEVAPWSRQLLLESVVGVVPQAVADAGGQQDTHDGRDGDQGEHHELGGVLLVCLLRQKLEFAFLQDGREGPVST